MAVNRSFSSKLIEFAASFSTNGESGITTNVIDCVTEDTSRLFPFLTLFGQDPSLESDNGVSGRKENARGSKSAANPAGVDKRRGLPSFVGHAG